MADEIRITSTDYWVKVVEMLQQNWALVEQCSEHAEAVVYFITDLSGVFDQLSFPDQVRAEEALKYNGFERYSETPGLHAFLRPPPAPFSEGRHSSGKIYSSGRFWQQPGGR